MSSTLTSYLVAMAIDLALGTPYARLIPASVNNTFIVARIISQTGQLSLGREQQK